MIVLLLSLVALATAAPYYHEDQGPMGPRPGPPHHSHHRHHGYGSEIADNYFQEGIFDTASVWQGLADDLRRLDTMIRELSTHFPSVDSSESVEGTEYKVSISLPGFEEKDIAVKAREGVLMIQAIHKTDGGSEKSYVDLRSLPTNINVAGSWTYNKGILKIVFPINKVNSVTVGPSEMPVTQVPEIQEHSREVMDNEESSNNSQDADVGASRGDRDNELYTNVITNNNPVEATTYAVDLKNEVEFVPVKY